jgi:hypothetical protein
VTIEYSWKMNIKETLYMLIDLAMHISYNDSHSKISKDKTKMLFDKKQENEEQSCYGMTHYQ